MNIHLRKFSKYIYKAAKEKNKLIALKGYQTEVNPESWTQLKGSNEKRI